MGARWLSIPIAAALMVSISSQANADIELAKKSGCLACHSIDKKIVGPAWNDVSERYKGDGAARATLISKVKSGGKGNWTAVTGGIPMPPYSPRVSDENIEKLVDFILTL
ncbi:c-type cytochrome [Pseudomonadota bacterium]